MADFVWAALIIFGFAAITVAAIVAYELWENHKQKRRMQEMKKNFDDEYWQ